MKGFIKERIDDDGMFVKYEFDKINWIRISNGKMTIDYISDDGQEHQEIGDGPEQMMLEDSTGIGEVFVTT